MKTILIISPDPQTNRMLALAFELEGWEVFAATNADSASPPHKPDIILYDAAEGAGSFKKEHFLRLQSKAKVMVISPRGMDDEDIKNKLPFVDFVSRRPFELMHLVHAAGEILS